LALPWGQNVYPENNEIHNFGRGLPALHQHAFSFSCIHVVSEKKIFKNFINFDTFCPIPKAPGAGNLNFTIYVPLVPKMHHTKFEKFEKNWRSGYQEVKNVQMLTDTSHVWPCPGGKTEYVVNKSCPVLLPILLLFRVIVYIHCRCHQLLRLCDF
jgi:hypothetical protein